MESKVKILIVDDEPDFVEAFQRILEAKSFHVITASSKTQAQEMMVALPDIVVLGTMAPAGHAFTLHQWLKKHPRYKDIPLMILDAKYEERSIRGWRRFEGMQMECEDYVSKPIEPALLSLRIQYMMDEINRIIKVLVADDHTMVRDGICAVLNLQKDMEIVGEAIDGHDAYDKVVRLLPNVALMDIVMPGMNGLEVTRMITRDCPDTKVLMLTQYDEKENMIIARNAGAYGFIPKKGASTELVTGIRSVSSGNYFPALFKELTV